MRLAIVVLALPLLAGCILCPGCGCYPESWSARWQQEEMSEWAAQHADDARFTVSWHEPDPALAFNASVAGLPEGSSLRGVTWRFGVAEGEQRTVTLSQGRDGPRLSYTYPGNHEDEDDGPKRGVLEAAVATFLQETFAGDAAQRQELSDRLMATWRAVDHYEWASGSVEAHGPWRLEALWQEHDWRWQGHPGHTLARAGGWSYSFSVAHWEFRAEGWNGTLSIDVLGRVEAGRVEGRRLDEAALRQSIGSEWARHGLPARPSPASRRSPMRSASIERAHRG